MEAGEIPEEDPREEDRKRRAASAAEGGPSGKAPRMGTAGEQSMLMRVFDDVASFKEQRQGQDEDVDLDAPVALKSSPSLSGGWACSCGCMRFLLLGCTHTHTHRLPACLLLTDHRAGPFCLLACPLQSPDLPSP